MSPTGFLVEVDVFFVQLRPAESDELGQAFQTKALKEDLMRLVESLDKDDGDAFADATDPPPIIKREVATALVPERRVSAKGQVIGC